MISIHGHQQSSAGSHALHNADMSVNRNLIAQCKRTLNADQYARKEIFRDVPKRDTDDQAHESRASEYRCGDLR